MFESESDGCLVRRNFLPAIVGSILATIPVSSSEAQIAEAKLPSGWSGYYDPSANDIRCLVTKNLMSDVYFIAALDRDYFFAIGVASPQWNKNVDVEIAGAVTIDGSLPIILKGFARDAHTLMFTTTDEEDDIEEPFETGRVLKLSYDGGWAEVDLRGSKVARAYLEDCYRNQAARRN